MDEFKSCRWFRLWIGGAPFEADLLYLARNRLRRVNRRCVCVLFSARLTFWILNTPVDGGWRENSIYARAREKERGEKERVSEWMNERVMCKKVEERKEREREKFIVRFVNRHSYFSMFAKISCSRLLFACFVIAFQICWSFCPLSQSSRLIFPARVGTCIASRF